MQYLTHFPFPAEANRGTRAFVFACAQGNWFVCVFADRTIAASQQHTQSRIINTLRGAGIFYRQTEDAIEYASTSALRPWPVCMAQRICAHLCAPSTRGKGVRLGELLRECGSCHECVEEEKRLKSFHISWLLNAMRDSCSYAHTTNDLTILRIVLA